MFSSGMRGYQDSFLPLSLHQLTNIAQTFFLHAPLLHPYHFETPTIHDNCTLIELNMIDEGLL